MKKLLSVLILSALSLNAQAFDKHSGTYHEFKGDGLTAIRLKDDSSFSQMAIIELLKEAKIDPDSIKLYNSYQKLGASKPTKSDKGFLLIPNSVVSGNALLTETVRQANNVCVPLDRLMTTSDDLKDLDPKTFDYPEYTQADYAAMVKSIELAEPNPEARQSVISIYLDKPTKENLYLAGKYGIGIAKITDGNEEGVHLFSTKGNCVEVAAIPYLKSIIVNKPD